jgi:hypothetical protein
MGSQVQLPAQKPLYGWTLRAASWVLRTVGVAATLGGFAAWQVPGWTWKGILVGTSIVGVVFTVTGLELGKYARRHLVPAAESPGSLAPGAYVLYLRPFSLDASMDELDSVFDNTTLSAFQSGRTHEERLARMFRKFGRLVTVGRPGEPLPRGSGARRVYIPPSGWQPIVADLISNARVVILGAGPGTGTVWEYVQMLRGGDPSRFIVLVTDTAWYQHFRKLATAAANEALAELRARHGSSFRLPDLPDLADLPSSVKPRRGVPPSYFGAMVFFDDDWEADLEFFTKTHDRGALAPVLAHVRAGVRASERSG